MPSITHVAIMQQDRIYSLPKPNRHADVIRMMIVEHGMEGPMTGIQGFLTEIGGFMNRKDAAKLAVDTRQVKNLSVEGELFSEDLW
jgi:hypothetical protein